MGHRVDALTPQERLFAIEVRRAHAAAGVSQEWIGREIRLSRGKVSELCSGLYLPQHDTVTRLIEVLGMDRDRVLTLWRDARDARAERLRTERVTRQTPAVSWARLPVLPAEITSLLQAQIVLAEESPYRLRGARRPSLSTVYVRQELGSGVEETQSDKRVTRADIVVPEASGDAEWRPVQVARPAAPRPTVRPPARKVREALDDDDHLLVIGGPGQGKSTLTLRLAADVAKAWPGQLASGGESVTEGEPQLAEPVVPLRLPARVLAARLDMPLPYALADSILAEYGHMLASPVAPGLLAGRVKGCRWLLLIDAIDEVAEPEVRHRLIRALSGCVADNRPYRLVATSRSLDGGGLAPLYRGAARYELQPFDAEAVRRFAAHWFGKGTHSCQRFLDQIRRAHLDELVHVPLLATIAAIIFERHGDRPLPDNRYGLYQEYLEYLAEARPGPNQDAFGRMVSELRTGLLEHLGLVRFEADVPLLTAAQAWVADHTTERPAHWQSTLGEQLVAVGPLVIRGDGDDVQFMHHSFAEHLAATAKARLLPDSFHTDNALWRNAIYVTRHGMARDHARAVILHATYLHRGLADQLVTWLNRNTSEFQLIAAELLAQHAPASADVVDAFLDTALAWAKTSSGTEIFRQVSHATHHPRLASWLADLIHRPDLTWSARVEAATALCTRVWSNEDEAIRLLHSAMGDQTLDLDDRRAAAQGLAQAGPEQKEAATRALIAVLEDPATAGETLRDAAIALADLGETQRHRAVQVLKSTMADAAVSGEDRLEAANALGMLGTEFHPVSALTLEAIIEDPGLLSYWDRAVVALGELGPGYVDQAAAFLENVINHPRKSASERAKSASILTELGANYVPLAAGHLQAILEDSAMSSIERWYVAEALGKLGPQYHSAAASHFRLVLADALAHANTLLTAATGLADLSPDYHQEAAEQLRKVHDDPLADEWARCTAVGKLASLGPAYREQAAALLRKIVDQSELDPTFREYAATELIDLGTEFHQEAAAALSLIVADSSNDSVCRASAAVTLAGIDTGFAVQAVDVLRALLASPVLDGQSRKLISRSLSSVGPQYGPMAAESLCIVMDDSTCRWSERAEAASQLVALGRNYREAAEGSLRAILAEPFSDQYLVLSVIRLLGSFGMGFRAEVGDLLRAIASDPARELSDRLTAATALVEFWREHRSAGLTTLNAILPDPAVGRASRLRALAQCHLVKSCFRSSEPV